MRLLLVEDDQALNQNLQQQLQKQGFAVDSALDGEEGLYLGNEYSYDVAVIDLGLPKLDGISLITKLRQHQKSYPILILTARDRWQEKVEGLNAGADDYLTKPFHAEELGARLNALIRRSAGQSQPVLNFGPVTIDTTKQSVALNGSSIKLTAYEYKLIELLALHPGTVFSKTSITEHIYDQDFDRDSNVIEVFIRRLRKKLDPENQYQLIETIRGQGYRINESSQG
jgi:two-component system response regulator PhoP